MNKFAYLILAFLIIASYFAVNKSTNITEKVASQIIKHQKEKLPVSSSQEVRSFKPKPNNFDKQKTVDKKSIENKIKAGLDKIREASTTKKSRLAKAKQVQLNKLDEQFIATEPSKYSFGEDGKLSGVFPKFTQEFSNAKEFIDEASELLEVNGQHQLVQQESECLVGEQCVTKYIRIVNDFPVLRDNIVIGINDGQLNSVMGALTAPNIDLEVLNNSNNLSLDDIEAAARGELPVNYQLEGIPTYGVYETNLSAIPAYQAKISNGFDGYDVIIHAQTKAVASKVSLVHQTNASGIDLNGASYAFNAIRGGDNYVMIDNRFPLNASTIVLDAMQASEDSLRDSTAPLDFSTSDSLTGGWKSSAVSVLSHFNVLVDYFNDKYDYQVKVPGDQNMEIVINGNMDNALAGMNRLIFGKTDSSNYANSRDVVAHELTHSIIRATSNLIYERQSGALNESFADFFGVLASDDGNWLLGEDIKSDGTYIRNMANPADQNLLEPQPYHISQYKVLPVSIDYGGVHSFSGIPNRFFYLLAEGNTDNPLGRQKAGELAFSALIGLNANANFSDFYLKMQSVASNELQLKAIKEAGKGVGFDLYEQTEDSVTISTRPSGENATVFLSPNFSNQSFDVNLQVYDSNLRTYEASKLYNLSTDSNGQRPAVSYLGDDTQEELAVLFKAKDSSIEYVYLNSVNGFGQVEFLDAEKGSLINRISTNLSLTSVATTFLASTEIANQIMLIDFITSETSSIIPNGPSYTEGYLESNVKLIDVVEFDPTGRSLVFDYLVESFEGDEYWSIGIYELSSGLIRYPFAKLPSNYSVGNPSFANTNSDYIAFDVFDSESQSSGIYILNSESGEIIPVSKSQIEEVEGEYYGQPSFTQNDNAVVFKVKTGNDVLDQYLYSQGLDDNFESVTNSGQSLNRINAAVAQRTVRGQVYNDDLTLSVETNTFDVGDILLEASEEICLINSSSHPIRLKSIASNDGLNLIDIPSYFAGGIKLCINLLIDVSEFEVGEFNLTATIEHDGTNKPILLTVSGNKLIDTDGDGMPDATDPDDDNDGTLDDDDAFPLDSTEIADNDEDGIGNNADTDDDNDGISDELELANGLNPLDASDASADLDGDGVSNADEIAAGSVVNADDQAPVFTSSVSDTQVIATGIETVVELSLPTATDVGSEVTVTSDAEDAYAVGTHIVTYTATDTAGNEAELKQTITVLPYVYLSAGQLLNDGQTITFDVTLSDTPLVYPVTADIVVSGSATSDDYALSTTSIEITEGLIQSIELSVTDDGFAEVDETIELALDNLVNAGIKPQSENSTVFTITEENLPPTVTLSVVQNEITSRIVEQSASVTVVADIVEVNGTDELSVTYSGIDNIEKVNDSFNITFDPAQLSVGTYTLRITVVDEGISQTHTVIEDVIILVKTVLPELTAADSDGDGIADNEEGFNDTDNDGVPDYLDSTPQVNLQPLGDSFAQADDGVLLALGAEALENGSNSLAVDATTLTEDTQYDYGELFDFTLSGLSSGATYSLVLPLTQVIPANAVYRKLTDAGWVDFVGDANNAVHSVITSGYCPAANDSSWQSGLVEGGTCIKLSIKDGSVNDLDGLANGKVVDPSGIAVVKPEPTPTPTPSNPSSGGSSGGSSTLYLMLMLITMVYIRRLKQLS